MPRLSCSSPVSISVTGMPALAKRHRDAAAHRAGADDGDPLDRRAAWCPPARRRSWRPRARRRTRSAAPWTGRWRPACKKPSRSFFSPSSNGKIDRRADRVSRRERRLQAARLLGHGGDRIGEDRAVGLGRRKLGVVVAQLAQRTVLREHLARESFTARSRPFDDLLDQAVLQGFGRADRLAADDHLHRLLGPDRRGSRCVPPAPGNRPSLTSGRPSRASVVATRIVADERQLEAAAERGAVDRGDDRLRRIARSLRSLRGGSAAAAACRIR